MSKSALSVAFFFCPLLPALAAGGAEPRDSLDLGDRPSEVRAVAFSPDGRLPALYNAKDRAVTPWDVATKTRTAALKSDGWIASWDFRFTADGKSLIVAGRPVIVWDAATRKERRRVSRFMSTEDAYGNAVFTPDGKYLMLASTGEGVLVFDLATGKLAKTIQSDGAPIGRISVMAVSPDGKTLAVGTTSGGPPPKRIAGGGALFLCDLEKGVVRHVIARAGADDEESGGLYDIDLLAFSPDGKRLLSTGPRRRLAVWDPVTGESTGFLRTGFELGRVTALAYAPDGKTLALASVDVVELWDVEAGGFRDDFWGMPKPRGTITQLAFSPDGKTLVTAGFRVPVDFWAVPTDAPKAVRKDTSPVRAQPPPPFPPRVPPPAP